METLWQSGESGQVLADAKRCGNTARGMEPATCMQRPDPHYRCYAALALSTVLALAGCGGGAIVRDAPPPTAGRQAWPQVAPADPVRANAVLMRAIGLVGTPYRYGGNTPEAASTAVAWSPTSTATCSTCACRAPRGTWPRCRARRSRLRSWQRRPGVLRQWRRGQPCRHLRGRRTFRARTQHRRHGAPGSPGRKLVAGALQWSASLVELTHAPRIAANRRPYS